MNKNGNFSEIMFFDEVVSNNNSNNITNREFFNQIHIPQRPEGHSANKIIVNRFDEIFAVKCNCGKIHPIFKNGKYSADWNIGLKPNLIVRYKNMTHNNFLNCIDL